MERPPVEDEDVASVLRTRKVPALDAVYAQAAIATQAVRAAESAVATQPAPAIVTPNATQEIRVEDVLEVVDATPPAARTQEIRAVDILEEVAVAAPRPARVPAIAAAPPAAEIELDVEPDEEAPIEIPVDVAPPIEARLPLEARTSRREPTSIAPMAIDVPATGGACDDVGPCEPARAPRARAAAEPIHVAEELRHRLESTYQLEALRPRRQLGAIVTGAVATSLVILGAAAVRSQLYTPPEPTIVHTVSTPRAALAAAPPLTAIDVHSLPVAAGTGTLTIAPGAHVTVDGAPVRGTAIVPCGSRAVRIGGGAPRTIDVPCGGGVRIAKSGAITAEP